MVMEKEIIKIGKNVDIMPTLKPEITVVAAPVSVDLTIDLTGGNFAPVQYWVINPIKQPAIMPVKTAQNIPVYPGINTLSIK